MKVLVVYASNSGNTMQAAELIGQSLAAAGSQVALRDVTQATGAELSDTDLTVLGSCTWLRQTPDGPKQGELPEQMHRFAQDLIRQKRTGAYAIFAFGRHEYTKFCGAADHLEEAVSAAGGHLATDTLRIDGFFEPNRGRIGQWAQDLARSVSTAA